MFSYTVVANVIRRIFHELYALNFYTSSSTDQEEIRTEVIATRVAIVLLTGSLVTLTLYSSLTVTFQTITVVKPTFAKYQSMFEKYPDVSCPCSNIALVQSAFIKVEPRYHQVHVSKSLLCEVSRIGIHH